MRDCNRPFARCWMSATLERSAEAVFQRRSLLEPREIRPVGPIVADVVVPRCLMDDLSLRIEDEDVLEPTRVRRHVPQHVANRVLVGCPRVGGNCERHLCELQRVLEAGGDFERMADTRRLLTKLDRNITAA